MKTRRHFRMFYFDDCPWVTDYVSISCLHNNVKLVVTSNRSMWLISHRKGGAYTVADFETYKGKDINDKVFLKVFCNEK